MLYLILYNNVFNNPETEEFFFVKYLNANVILIQYYWRVPIRFVMSIVIQNVCK